MFQLLKTQMGGGVEPRYNLSSDILCVLTLKDNSTVYITGENTFNMEDIQPYQENVVSAIITNRCTSIGMASFAECKHLSSVIIPDSVSSIGVGAFISCPLLSNITIPPSVTSIENSVFLDCTSLSNVTLSNNITKLDTSTFQGCTSLEHISLPNRLKELGNYVFYNCGLKELIIPEGVTKIEGGTIASCPNLESVNLPSSLEEVSYQDFLSDCGNLKYIKISGTKDMTDMLNFYKISNKSDLTLYVDSSLVDTYKAKKDSYHWAFNILPLQQ